MPNTTVKYSMLDDTIKNALHNEEVIFTAEADIPANTVYDVPDNFSYIVGNNLLSVSVRGTLWYKGINFEEVGKYGERSSQIKFIDAINKGDIVSISHIEILSFKEIEDEEKAAETTNGISGSSEPGTPAS